MSQDLASRPRTRLEPAASLRLTGLGAVAGLFAVSFAALLLAAWTGWIALADAAFVTGCGVVAYYTRLSGLRAVVVAPPLAFFAGCACAELLTAPDHFVALEEILITLGTGAPWLLTGTVLAIIVAFGRGFRLTMTGLRPGAVRGAARTSPAPGPPRPPPRC
jgi:hypothetical protein